MMKLSTHISVLRTYSTYSAPSHRKVAMAPEHTHTHTHSHTHTHTHTHIVWLSEGSITRKGQSALLMNNLKRKGCRQRKWITTWDSGRRQWKETGDSERRQWKETVEGDSGRRASGTVKNGSDNITYFLCKVCVCVFCVMCVCVHAWAHVQSTCSYVFVWRKGLGRSSVAVLHK